MKTKLIYTVCLGLAVVLICGYYFWPVKQVALFKMTKFSQLPGWNSAVLSESLHAFQRSCRVFMRQDPQQFVGTKQIELKAKDWQPACYAALRMNPRSQKKLRAFFEAWFIPVEFSGRQSKPGLFTGYYLPTIKGSYKESKEFHVPIYETPSDLLTSDLGLFFADLKHRRIVGRLLGKKLVPYYTREQINQGAIKDKARVLFWTKSSVDRLFLEIQGSGIIELENGKTVAINYDAQNGAPYTAIAGVLIKKGVMTRDNASMQAIRRYLEAHPQQIGEVINQNKSFVFFRKAPSGLALGAQGLVLTPGYSLAVDRQWIPMGVPLWLTATRPSSSDPYTNRPIQRLMIAQDTGGAIRGPIRGDVFWGSGEQAAIIAGHMKNPGYYWLLLPRHVVPRLCTKP